MQPDIHPQLNEITVTCACGHSFRTSSTMRNDFAIEICSHCHPYFTGKQKLIDTAGKVDKFRKKYAKFEAAKEKAKAKH